MKQARFLWQQGTTTAVAPELASALQALGIDESLYPYAASLGLTDEASCQKFFAPTFADLNDPYLLSDMEKTIARLRQAIEQQEQILIYGDYDADGITSTTILKEALEMVGANVVYYLPNRFKDGYGPNQRVYQEFIDFGVQLIVTVDNGVSGHAAIDYANSRNVDVIVTDHHELPEELPQAYSIVHPRHPAGHYPFGQLAGCGVAFKLACALLEEIPSELLELVAIGTVADLVPLVDENRALVQLGLQQMQVTERLGLQALLQVAKVDLTQISEEDIGFQIAPRLNALGRMADASVGVELLSTFDLAEAENLAQLVDTTNQERKELVSNTFQSVVDLVDTEAPVIFAAHEAWHEGILGIVAGKLAQEYRKPALIMTINPETQIAKGSGRSVGDFNLYEALKEVAPLFTAFGGHSMAAGFSLATTNLKAVEEQLAASFTTFAAKGPVQEELFVPFTLTNEQLTLEIYQQLQRFAPFGTEHPKPAVLLEKQHVTNVKNLGVNGAHLKLQVTGPKEAVDVLAFNKGSESFEFLSEQSMDLVVNLNLNQWNGAKKLQLMLVDYQVSEKEFFDYRGQKNRLPILPKRTTYYLVFQKSNLKRLKLPQEQVLDLEALPQLLPSDNLIVADCPTSLAQLKTALKQTQATRIFLWCYSFEEAYLNGIPSRQKFAILFKFIKVTPNLDVRYKLAPLAKHLKLSESLLIFMIQVFFDLNFVTIENGVMNAAESVSQKELTASPSYQARFAQMKTEEFLLYASIPELNAWLATKEENHES